MIKHRKTVLVLSLSLAFLLLLSSLVFVEMSDESSNIRNVYDALWYSLVTLTAVGYGDYYPVTPAGKVFGFVLLLMSLVVIGFIVGKTTDKLSQLREKKKMGLNGTGFSNHMVIIGWDDFAHSVALQLVNADNRVVVVTRNRDDIDLIYEDFSKDVIFVLYADLKNPAILEKANIREAFMTFVNLENDSEKLIAIINIKKEFPDNRFIVALENSELKDTFYNAGVNYVLSKNEIASKLIASYIFEPDVANYTNDLISSASGDDDFDIQQFKVIPGNPFTGKTYGEAFRHMKEKYNVVLIGLCKNGGCNGLKKLPDDSETIEQDDHLIMILNGNTEKKVSELFGIKEGAFR